MLRRAFSLILICAILFSSVPLGALADDTGTEPVVETPVVEEVPTPDELPKEEEKQPTVEEPKSPPVEEPKAPVEEEPKTPAAEEPKEPVEEEPVEEPKEPVEEEPKTPAAEEPKAPVEEEPKAPAAEEPQEPIADEIKETPTEEAPSYSMSVSPAALTFDAAKLETKTVTVTNDGNAELTLSLSESNNYEIGDLSASTLAAGDKATFTVVPKAGLNEGEYAETITVTAEQGVGASVEVKIAALKMPAQSLSAPAQSAGAVIPPTRLAVNGSGYNRLEVTWTAATEGTGYELQHSTDPDFTTGLKTIPISGIDVDSYQDTSLTVGLTYYYRIRTVDATSTPTVYSVYTNNEVSCLVAPLMPTTASVRAAGSSGAKLTWTNASGAKGVIIYRDNVYIAKVPSTATTYTDYGDYDLGLTIGSKYAYSLKSYYTTKVDGVTTDVESVDAYKINYTARPATPTSLKATSAGLGKIKLTWKAISGVDGYYVYRSSMSGDNYKRIADVADYTKVTYTDSTVQAGATYYYYVVSYVGTSVSAIPQYVEGKSIPLAVTNAKATSVSSTKIKLTWSDSQDVSGYRIMHSETKDGEYLPLTPDATGKSYTITNLVTSSNHYYRIYPFITIGEDTDIIGEPSVLLYAYPKPAAPTGLTLTNKNYRAMTLTWNATTGADGYEIWSSTSSNGTYTYMASVTGTTYSTKTVLTCGVTYYYKVRAYIGTASNKVGYGSYSSPKSRMAMPPATKSLTASVVSSNNTSVKLTWEKVSGVTGYRIYQKVNGGGRTYVGVASGADTLTYTVKNCVPGSRYVFEVRPYRNCSGGVVAGTNYKASNSVQIELSTPTTYTATDGITSFIVKWATIPGATGYDIQATCKEDDSFSLDKSLTATSYTFTDVTAGYRYAVKVRAYSTASGSRVTSNWSEAIAARVLPSKPTSIKVAVAGLKAVVTWKAPAFADGYTVYRATSVGGPYTKLGDVNDAFLTYTDGLTTEDIGNTYFYRVRSFINPLGTQFYSPSPSGVKAMILPSKTKLYGSPLSYSSFHLEWDAVTGAQGYTLLRSSSKDGTYSTYKTLTGSGTELDISNLTPGKKYYFKVRAYAVKDTAKVYGELSNAKLVQGRVVAPVTVTTSAATNKVVIRWSAVSGANGYYIYRSNTASGEYSRIGSASSTARSYADKNLTCGKTYYYKVAGYHTYNGARTSGDKSDYAKAKTFAVTPTFASKPYSVQSTTKLTIKWNAVSGVEGYRIYASSEADGSYSRIGTTYGANSTTFAITDMKLGVYRYFKVRSFASSQQSDYSDYIEARTTPIKPSKVTAGTITKSSIKVSWKASKGADGYTVYYKSSKATKYSKLVLMGSGVLQASLTGLSAKTTYQIRVRPFCIDGNGDKASGGYSSILTVKTK